MGSFTMAEEGRRRTSGLSMSLAISDGRVIGGVVAGILRAGRRIQVIVRSFLPNSLKQHQRRNSLKQHQRQMNLQLQPSPASAQAVPMPPPPVLTAAMPISQASPGNGFHAPQPAREKAVSSAAAPPATTRPRIDAVLMHFHYNIDN